MRRIKGLLLFFILLLLVGAGGISPSGVASGATFATPIRHVIYIMMENHSFDNLFGVYPGTGSSIETPRNLINPGETTLPSLSGVPAGTFSTSNPREDVYPQDYDNGAMDGFAKYSGPQSMTYFTSAQLAVEWDWAEEYGLGDNYFSSVLSETTPNRLVSLAGYTPVMSDTGPPPYVPVDKTIFAQMSEYGVTWKVYGTYPSSYPMNFFSGLDNYSYNFASWNEFQLDLNHGDLPQVSYISSLGGSDVDQHPPDNVTYGEVWLLGMVNEVMQSPYWNSSAIFINYDEGGGYYDQVPPPQLDGLQLGFRVPLIVISPYSKEDYVSHTMMNHDSILAFIEYNLGLPALNTFVGDSNLPLDFFNFSQTPRDPVILNSSSAFPSQPQIPFDQLTYPRSGSSSTNLGQAISSQSLYSSQGVAGATRTIQSATSESPNLQSLLSSSTLLLITIAAVVFVLLSLIVGFARSKRRWRR